MLFHLNLTIMTIISILIQLCLTISLGIHKTAYLIDLFSGRSCCVETSHLIWVAYRLTGFSQWECLLTGFFEQAIRYHFLLALALSLLDFLRLLLIYFKYLVYLVFFIKCFFSTQDWAFPMSRV